MANHIPVVGEMEFSYGFIKEPIVAVSGTNGKTTTTELLGKMLRHSGIRTFVGGNIGNPLIEYVDQSEKADVVVAEVSSFQLDTIRSFRPTVGILLNITDDHLDRYENPQAYETSKWSIFKHQMPADTAVINGSIKKFDTLSKKLKSKIFTFS